MALFNFFVTYLLFLLTSSILITSFFCITRGDIEVMPDGSKRRYGKILKGYYFFWFKEKDKAQIRYADDELAHLVDQIKSQYSGSITLLGDIFKEKSITSFEVSKNFLESVPILRYQLQVQFKIEEQNNGSLVVSAYSEAPVYSFPEWLRTIMAGCVTCTPTVYGNITYWSAILFFKKSILYSLFGCFENMHAAVIIVWLAYWVSLAWLNTVLWNIYNATEK
jgi:hypothetical protein